MILKNLVFFVGMVSLAVVTGCASIMHGSSQEMSFQSSPEDVTVTVGGRIIGKTPITSRLDKKSGQTVIFTKDGYKPVTMALTTSLDPWFWGNIVLGGFIGSTTDGINGSVDQYQPSQYFITLTPVAVSQLERFTWPSEHAKAERFIISNYTSLMANLSQGGGETYGALLGLLHRGPEQEAVTLDTIQTLASVHSDAPVFAKQVTALYLKQ